MAQQPAVDVYIGDLPPATNEDFLRSFFQEICELNNSDILIKKHKTLEKNFAFIKFPSHEAAANAINTLNYTKLDGVPIRMSWADPETKRIRQLGLGNLFIRGLDESIEVSQLHEAFSNFGEIISCKIPLTDGKSRGYGYIQFKNKDDAEKARNDLAEASINGKQITIEDYHKPAKKNQEEIFTNVFIKPLPAEIFQTEDQIKEILSAFGDIQSIKLVKNKDGQPFIDRNDHKEKVFAFCNFTSHEAAVRATEELKEISGYKVECCRAMTKKERTTYLLKQSAEFRKMKNQQTQGRNIFVKGFSEAVSEEEFRHYFEQFGQIENCKIAIDPKTNTSMKYGYVLYVIKEDAEKAIANSLNYKLGDLQIFVSIFKPRDVRQRENLRRTRDNEKQKSVGPIHTQSLMNQTMDPMQMQMQMQMQQPNPNTPKDILKRKLQEIGLNGSDLKKKLVSVSDEQAASILKDEDKFQRWASL